MNQLEGQVLDCGVYCCQPQYSGGIPSSHRQFWRGGSVKYPKRTHVDGGGSLLANTFNKFWVHALNLIDEGQDITHFVMLHDDIVPQDGWIDVLMDEINTTGADIVSAVVPIKDWMGLTSVAIDGPDPFLVTRRVTMTEVYNLPETFSGSDCGYRDDQLLVNTGCWVADLRKPWVREEDEYGNLKVFFTIKDRLRKLTVDGKSQYICEVAPEDWNFSRMVNALGGKIMVTRKVKLLHYGQIPFNNQEPWGTSEYDRLLGHQFDNKMIVKEGYEFVDQAVDVTGWLSEEEGKALSELAKDKTVLEIGSYCGRSTVYMARTAKLVCAVDTFDGSGTPFPRDTLTEFKNNLLTYKVLGQVKIYKGKSEDMYDQVMHKVDLAFIDGCHDKENILKDYTLAKSKLKEDGKLAFHDYGQPEHPAVMAFVNELLNSGKYEALAQYGTIIVIQPV